MSTSWRLLAACALTVLAAGCATQGVNTFQYAKNTPTTTQNEVRIAQPYSQTWDRLVRELSKSFYVINNIDRESRIINISFSSNEPTDYVDCGRSRRTYREGEKIENYDYAVAGPATFKVAAKQQEHPSFSNYAVLKRATSLEGRTNIYLAPAQADNSSTLVTVNTRYILTIKVSGHVYAKHISGNVFDRGVMPQRDATTMAFNTNKPVDRHDEATGDTMTCFATGKLEREILQMAR
jgi:hypothetical protein